MRKFQHKKTKIIATQCSPPLATYYDVNDGRLPSWAIENSNDWEEIIEPPKRQFVKVLRCSGGPFTWYSNKLQEVFEVVSGFAFTSYTIVGGSKLILKRDCEPCTEDGTLIEKLKVGRNMDNWAHNLEYAHDLGHRVNPKPLFTTEDKVDIFPGDFFHWVHPQTFRISPPVIAKAEKTPNPANLKFHSLAEAKAYVVTKDRIYVSMDEIISAINYNSLPEKIKDGLNKLFHQKLFES